MSTGNTSSRQPSLTAERLEVLYAEQHSLIERLHIHQNNLHILLSQKANFGIDVPLRIVNEIALQEKELVTINKRLTELDGEVSVLLKHAVETETPQQASNPVINIDGADYIVDVPYPFTRADSQMLPDGRIQSTMYYAGGFEIRSILTSTNNHISFYLHRRQIAPFIERPSTRIIVPIGSAITVTGVALNTKRLETLNDVTADRISEGRWTVLSPSMPQRTLITSDWPQGYKDYLTTMQLTYERGYEVWMVQVTGDPNVKLWFYINDWNVAPIVDPVKLTLSFPAMS